MSKTYRLHITCQAGHTTYADYKTKRAALRNLLNMTDKNDWYATHIDVLTRDKEAHNDDT
jgi:hypothetical protein